MSCWAHDRYMYKQAGVKVVKFSDSILADFVKLLFLPRHFQLHHFWGFITDSICICQRLIPLSDTVITSSKAQIACEIL